MSKKCAKLECLNQAPCYKKCLACNDYFHSSCGEFCTYKDCHKKKRYLCHSCNKTPKNTNGLTLVYQSRVASSSSQGSTKRPRKTDSEDELDDNDAETGDIQGEINLKTLLDAINTGNRKMRSKMDGLTEVVRCYNESINDRCEQIEESVETLKEEITSLKSKHEEEIDLLKDKINDLEHKSSTELYIHGYLNAADPNLDIVVAVTHIAELLDVEISGRDIRHSRVIARKNQSLHLANRPPILAVDFFSHSTASRLVEAKRAHGKLLNKDVLETPSNDTIAISFPLSRDQYTLLQATKSRATMHNVKYVWNSNGKVMIRPSDGARATRIKNTKHLDAVLPPTLNMPQPMDTQQTSAE